MVNVPVGGHLLGSQLKSTYNPIELNLQDEGGGAQSVRADLKPVNRI